MISGEFPPPGHPHLIPTWANRYEINECRQMSSCPATDDARPSPARFPTPSPTGRPPAPGLVENPGGTASGRTVGVRPEPGLEILGHRSEPIRPAPHLPSPHPDHLRPGTPRIAIQLPDFTRPKPRKQRDRKMPRIPSLPVGFGRPHQKLCQFHREHLRRRVCQSQ